ncbi:hypothetical protein D3C71_1470620 [compost metagenome]
MRGDRMHADGGIADQRTAIAGERVGIHPHQGIRHRRGHRPHRAQPMLEEATDAAAEVGLVLGHQGRDLTRRQRDDGRGLVAIERQQGHRAAIAEPLPGGVLVRHLDLHAADQHRFAEVTQLRADPQQAAGGGEAAVGSDHQPRGQLAAIGQGHHVVGRARADGRDGGLVQDLQTRLALHALPGGATEQMVWHQPAQVVTGALVRGEGQRERRAAIHHLGIAQRGNLGGIQLRPQAQRCQDLAGGMGQRDLTAIERGLRQRGTRLLFDQGDAQAGIGQRASEAQPGRARAHHHHIH